MRIKLESQGSGKFRKSFVGSHLYKTTNYATTHEIGFSNSFFHFFPLVGSFELGAALQLECYCCVYHRVNISANVGIGYLSILSLWHIACITVKVNANHVSYHTGSDIKLISYHDRSICLRKPDDDNVRFTQDTSNYTKFTWRVIVWIGHKLMRGRIHCILPF